MPEITNAIETRKLLTGIVQTMKDDGAVGAKMELINAAERFLQALVSRCNSSSYEDGGPN